MVILETLATVSSGVAQINAIGKPQIDGAVFRLHYRLTATIIFASSLLLSQTDLTGEKIKCFHDISNDDQPFNQRFVSNYCYLSRTFTVAKYISGPDAISGRTGLDAIAPGVGAFSPRRNEEITYQSYYLWVPFILLLSGASFRITRVIWKNIENKKLEKLIGDWRPNASLADADAKRPTIDDLANYLYKSRGTHSRYFAAYLACEFANLLIVMGNFVFMNAFLGGKFAYFGFDIFAHFDSDDAENRVDPLSRVFPKVVKCNFYTFGPSGSVQNKDSMCILPSNVLNEKIFAFLWFWFMILTIATFMSLLHWATFLFKSRRLGSLASKSGNIAKENLTCVINETGLFSGDFFLLYRLAQNMALEGFDPMITELAERITTEEAAKRRRRYRYSTTNDDAVDGRLPEETESLASNRYGYGADELQNVASFTMWPNKASNASSHFRL